MIDLFAFAAAIVLVMAVLMLRSLCAMPFPRLHGRQVDARAPAGCESLFAEAETALKALGFEDQGWMLVERVDGGAPSAPLRQVYRHLESGDLVCIAPPMSAKHPHRLLTWFCHGLADGRMAVSQPYDPYFAGLAATCLPARTLVAPDLPAQWKAHQEWTATLGPARSLDGEAGLIEANFGQLEKARQELLARGDLRALGPDLALPRFGYALRLLRNMLGAPKPPPDTRPVPPERLAMLARIAETVRERSPPRRVQWGLFATSVLLFMGLGAVIWDAQLALIVLGVILLHELGHFLAMRAFGYRNTHLLALPLVGGVAMGVDANPSATRKAWMSLMGPLPGIALGWALLAWMAFGTPPQALDGWLLPSAMMLLLINYLNVIPVPPLDGAHVAQALLPRRLARLRTVLFGLACLAGAALAMWFEFWLLVLLPLLQLLGLPSQWKLHRVEDRLASEPGFNALHPSRRLQRAFVAIEDELGSSPLASARIEQGLGLVHGLRTRPMGHLARLATGSVFAVLLVVPVLAGALYLANVSTLDALHAPPPREIDQAMETLEHEAAKVPVAELLAHLPPVAPASPEAIAASEARLGGALPDELLAFYRLRNGVDEWELWPVERIGPAAPVLDQLAANGIVRYTPEEYEEGVPIDADVLRDWWQIAGDGEALRLYDPTPESADAVRVVWVTPEGETFGAATALRRNREQAWKFRRMEELQQPNEAERDAARARLADASIDELLAVFPQPHWALRLLGQAEGWPGPAEPAAIDALEARFGSALPTAYRELLTRHDGFPPLSLLAVDRVADWRSQRHRIHHVLPFAAALANGQNPDDSALSREVVAANDVGDLLDDCLVIGGSDIQHEQADMLVARLLLCPAHSRYPGLIDLAVRRRDRDFSAWMLDHAATEATW